VLIAQLAIALHASSFPQPAGAEEPLQQRPLLTVRYSDDLMHGTEGTLAIQRVDIPAPPVPRECRPRYMAGPAVGLPLGVYAIASGTIMVRAGTDMQIFSSPPRHRDPMLIGWGGALIAAGVGTFIYSSVKLAMNRHVRRRVCGSEQSN
jgi:hypothetical protein